METRSQPINLDLAAVVALSAKKQAPADDIATFTRALHLGDEAAWREFHGRYFSRLFRYLLVVTGGNEDLAGEALQQTMLRAVRHMRLFESGTVFWSWLTVLARSAAVDELRKQSRRLSFLERLFAARPPAPADPDAEERLHDLIGDALAALDDKDRDLLRRKYQEGESVRHIAGALETTEKAIESRLVRVRRELREHVLGGIHRE
jgi:RNA polymerase sigma-70 factor (ECF subfamily)